MCCVSWWCLKVNGRGREEEEEEEWKRLVVFVFGDAFHGVYVTVKNSFCFIYICKK